MPTPCPFHSPVGGHLCAGEHVEHWGTTEPGMDGPHLQESRRPDRDMDLNQAVLLLSVSGKQMHYPTQSGVLEKLW